MMRTTRITPLNVECVHSVSSQVQDTHTPVKLASIHANQAWPTQPSMTFLLWDWSSVFEFTMINVSRQRKNMCPPFYRSGVSFMWKRAVQCRWSPIVSRRWGSFTCNWHVCFTKRTVVHHWTWSWSDSITNQRSEIFSQQMKHSHCKLVDYVTVQPIEFITCISSVVQQKCVEAKTDGSHGSHGFMKSVTETAPGFVVVVVSIFVTTEMVTTENSLWSLQTLLTLYNTWY